MSEKLINFVQFPNRYFSQDRSTMYITFRRSPNACRLFAHTSLALFATSRDVSYKTDSVHALLTSQGSSQSLRLHKLMQPNRGCTTVAKLRRHALALTMVPRIDRFEYNSVSAAECSRHQPKKPVFAAIHSPCPPQVK